MIGIAYKIGIGIGIGIGMSIKQCIPSITVSYGEYPHIMCSVTFVKPL